MLSGTCFAVVPSRLFQAAHRVEPLDRRHRGAASRRDDDRLARDKDSSPTRTRRSPSSSPVAAEKLDAAFLEPGQLAGVVEVVDHLVAAGEDGRRIELAGDRLG